MPFHPQTVPIDRGAAATPLAAAIEEDEFNATLWRSPQGSAAGPVARAPRDARSDVPWPHDGGRVTRLHSRPWEGASAIWFDFRLQQDLEVHINPREELLLTFLLAGDVSAQLGRSGSAAHARGIDFQPGRALLRTPNPRGGYVIQLRGACRNVFVHFRLQRESVPRWLRALDVRLAARQMEQLLEDDDGTVMCNAALTPRIRACLGRLQAEDPAHPAFVPLFQARATELLTYGLLDLGELLRSQRSSAPAERPATLADEAAAAAELARRAQACIAAAPAQRWTVPALARELGCSPARLQGALRGATGETVHQLLRSMRLELAARLLRETRLNIQAVAQEAGWECHGRFGAAFRQRFGVGPRAYRLTSSPRSSSAPGTGC